MKQTDEHTTFAGKVLTLLYKAFTRNIGTWLFGILFVYMIVSAIMYHTSTHYTSYQVISGPLSRNETYTGLVLREETVVTSDLTGYISYYAREGMKINASGMVYGISADQAPAVAEPLDQKDLEKIRKQMSSFSQGFSMSHFNDTYSFKYELEGNILQYSGAAASQAEGGNGAVTISGQTICRAAEDGLVLYYKDGYEKKTIENLKESDFDQNSYQKTNLKTMETVQAGQEIYTLVTDEWWNLLIPLSEKQAARLEDKTSIRVKFLKDGISQVGDIELIKIDGKTYGNLLFNKGLIRYAADRFLDIELVTNIQSGLKIPLSAIVSRDFYVIPTEYATYGGSGNTLGFLKQGKSKETMEFISPAIFGEENGYYYVEKSELNAGDTLIREKSSDRYKISKTEALEGVFCINKGYPVFRKVSILDQNEEFAIVRKDAVYGLSRYDFIVQDASRLDAEDLIK